MPRVKYRVSIVTKLWGRITDLIVVPKELFFFFFSVLRLDRYSIGDEEQCKPLSLNDCSVVVRQHGEVRGMRYEK